MRIHHLQCGTTRPWGIPRQREEISSGLPGEVGTLVCHCLLIENGQELVLVDTGLGLRDITGGGGLPFYIRWIFRPFVREEETAVRQIERMGFRASDVHHILLTHLDFEQTGGLADFPMARVHLLAEEYQAATMAKRFARLRYCARRWLNPQSWRRYHPSGEYWFGFRSVRHLPGLPPEVVLVPLPGHTSGHCGVATETDEGWLLHAGDAYFHQEEKCLEPGPTSWALRAWQWLLAASPRRRAETLGRLRELVGRHGNQVEIFCAHDPVEFRDLRTVVHCGPPERKERGRAVS